MKTKSECFPRRIAWGRLTAIAWVAAVFVSGCALSGINKGDINMVSSSEEVAMGREFAAEVESQYEVYDDSVLTAYVQSVGDRVAAVSDRPDIEYHFAVIRGDEVNAFALPGGYIYVYTGLLRQLDDEGQLAAVLAHEVGHVAARHATERLTAMYGAQMATSLLLGQNPAEYKSLIANLFSNVGFLAYSRSNEYEADRLGTSYVSAAGYDPQCMSELLDKFLDTEARDPSLLEEWLSTHPPTKDRIGQVDKLVAGMPGVGTGERDKARYERMKARLP